MLIYQEETKDYQLGIWKVEENQDQLLSFFSDNEKIMESIDGINSQSKILERLAVRILLRSLLKKDIEILYYDNGRPFLKDKEANISISHTKGYVAVILTSHKYVGIDIQYITEKVKKVRSRFISDKEFIDTNKELEHLLLHWSTKETLYKAISKGADLRNSFLIEHFIPENEGVLKASEHATGFNLVFDVNYKVTTDYVLTYTLSD